MFPSCPLCLCESNMNFSHKDTKDTAMIAMFLGVPMRSQKPSRINLMSFSLTNVKISDVVVFMTFCSTCQSQKGVHRVTVLRGKRLCSVRRV